MSRLQILIAENQYFIALDVEHLLNAALSCDIEIVPLDGIASALERQNFDIAIVEAEAKTAANIERAITLESKGTTVIFLSSYAVSEPDPSHVGSRPQIQKPLIHNELVELVRESIRQRSTSNGKGLFDDR